MTVSEVATLQYIIPQTSIPVPHVYDTSTKNKLGFEITRCSSERPLVDRNTAVGEEEDTHHRNDLRVHPPITLRFGKMSSMCLSNQMLAPLHWLRSSVRNGREVFVPLPSNPQLTVGPMIAIPFFYGNRIKL